MSFSSAPDVLTGLLPVPPPAHMTSGLHPTGQIGHPRSHLVLMVLLWTLNTLLKWKLKLSAWKN